MVGIHDFVNSIWPTLIFSFGPPLCVVLDYPSTIMTKVFYLKKNAFDLYRLSCVTLKFVVDGGGGNVRSP